MRRRRRGLGTTAGLRERARKFRDALLALGAATPDEIASYWPGGERNRDRGHDGWVYCYGQLARLMGRTEQQEHASEAEQTLARLAAEDALRGAVQLVRLTDPDRDGKPRSVAVAPKSYHALVHITERDGYLGRLALDVSALAEASSGAAILTRGQAIQEMNYQHRVLCWIVCQEGCQLPFRDSEERPEPPAWTEALSPFDIVRIIEAHKLVNGVRLQLALRLLAPPEPGTGQRIGAWATILVTASERMKIPVQTLARDYTLESLIAQLAIAREGERAAAESLQQGAA